MKRRRYLKRRQSRASRLPIQSYTANLQILHYCMGAARRQGQTARTTGSCNLEKCKTGVGFSPVMPWLYAPLAILSSATSTNMSTCMLRVMQRVQSCQLDLERAKTHFLFVFSAQKVKKSLAIAPTAPYTELLPTMLWNYNALKSVCSNLRLEVRKSEQRQQGWPGAQMMDAHA
jgi:hypothetical protein